jgi:MFS family permease
VRRLLLLVSIIVFVDTVFYAAITPLLPRFADELDLSKGGAGVLAAAYPAGTLIAAIPGGVLAARVGVKPTVLVGLALMGGSSLVFAFAHHVVLLDLARVVQGAGGAASWAGALGWLIGAAPADRRGTLVGTAMGAAIVGALVGPAFGALAAATSVEAVFSSVAVMAAVLAAWALRLPAAAPRGSRLSELWRAVRDPSVAAAMWLVTLPGLLFGTIAVLVPLRLDALGAGSTAIAGAFLLAAALEAIVSPVAGRAADRRGRVAPALVGIGAAGIVMAAFPWPDAAWLLGVLVVVASPAVGILWAPAMAMLADGADAHGIEQGLAFALMNFAWAAGQTAGASGSARLAQATGDEVPYLLLAGVCVVSFAVLRRGARRVALPA